MLVWEVVTIDTRAVRVDNNEYAVKESGESGGIETARQILSVGHPELTRSARTAFHTAAPVACGSGAGRRTGVVAAQSKPRPVPTKCGHQYSVRRSRHSAPWPPGKRSVSRAGGPRKRHGAYRKTGQNPPRKMNKNGCTCPKRLRVK